MKEALEQLFPPGIKPVQRWRLAVFAGFVVGALHIAWACGALAWAGVEGFAKAGEVRQVNEQVASIKLDLLESSLFDIRLKQCKSTPESRNFYTQKLQELLRKYREATRVEYRLPACEEL